MKRFAGALRQLAASNSEIEQFMQANLDEFNGEPGEPASYRLLEALLSEQYYKLAHWLNINESINYRRFFTITDLVGMRVEDPAVFEATHSADPAHRRPPGRQSAVGLRIDHVDGLRDPEGYLQKLREKLRETRAGGNRTSGEPLPGDSASGDPADAYLIVEKILAPDEQLPAAWPIDGTTGYDYLNHANGIFTYRDNAGAIEKIYSHFIGKEMTFADVAVEKKRELVMNSLLGVEIRALGGPSACRACGRRPVRTRIATARID